MPIEPRGSGGGFGGIGKRIRQKRGEGSKCAGRRGTVTGTVAKRCAETDDRRRSGGSFPLTPALSLREREKLAAGFRYFDGWIAHPASCPRGRESGSVLVGLLWCVALLAVLVV